MKIHVMHHGEGSPYWVLTGEKPNTWVFAVFRDRAGAESLAQVLADSTEEEASRLCVLVYSFRLALYNGLQLDPQ